MWQACPAARAASFRPPGAPCGGRHPPSRGLQGPRCTAWLVHACIVVSLGGWPAPEEARAIWRGGRRDGCPPKEGFPGSSRLQHALMPNSGRCTCARFMHSHAYSLTVRSALSAIARSLFHRSGRNQIADFERLIAIPATRVTARRSCQIWAYRPSGHQREPGTHPEVIWPRHRRLLCHGVARAWQKSSLGRSQSRRRSTARSMASEREATPSFW